MRKDAKPATTRGWALASALLMAMGMGCVNPLFFDDVTAAVNHAPVVANMRPAPSFERLELNFGVNCAPLFSFFPDFIDDADLDVLSVRWTLLMETSGVVGGLRATLRDEELEPLPEPVDGRFYAFTPFQVTRDVIISALIPENQTTDPQIEGQLLELTVSDAGFKPGNNTSIPNDGAGVFYMSWPVKLTNLQCEAL